MCNHCKYGIFLFILLVYCSISHGQVLNGGNGHSDIQAEFVKENINIEPRSPFFNVLKIHNASEREQFVNLQYETPVGWSLISQKEYRLNISPNDTVTVPLRASANKQVKGEIGYSIVASLTSRSGQPITSAYCFIKIPKISRVRFHPLTRVSYIDQQKKRGAFSFRLINSGNVDEVVYLNFTSTPNLKMEQEINNEYATDVLLPAKSDTTLNFEVIVEKEQAQKSLYRINLTGHTEEQRFNSSFWFKNLVSSYEYDKPSSEIPLILELNMSNLFSEASSYFSGTARGNILFPKNRNLRYYFHKFPNRGTRRSFLQSSKFFFNYQQKRWNMQVGNRIPFHLRNGYGKGAMVQYNVKDAFTLQGKYTHNEFDPINNYGFGTTFNLFDSELSFKTGFELSDDRRTDYEVLLGTVENRFKIRDEHSFLTEFGMSTESNNLELEDRPGLHYYVNYQGQFDDLQVRFRNRYDSEDYYGSFYGKNDLKFHTTYPYKDYRFNLFFQNSKYNPSSIYQQDENSDKYRLQRQLSLRTSKFLNNVFTVFGEPEYEYFNSNSFFDYSVSNPFITNGAYLQIGGRMNIGTYSRLNASLKGGMTFVTNFDEGSKTPPQISVLEERDDAFTAIFNLSYYTRNWGVFFKYNYGPYNGNQYYTYFYTGSFNQLLRLMPYYRDYVYKDIIELDSRLNYMYSINYQTHRLNLGNEVRVHMDYGLMLRLIANYTLQSTIGESQQAMVQEEQKYTYSNTYFELRLQKKFDWNQPRMKYYDLKVNLYKDLNGNLAKDGNEPGVKNVLVNIERVDVSKIDSLDVDYESSGNLVNNRLLSNMQGRVAYDNIPQGVYKLNLQNVGKESGKFSADQQEVLVHMNRNRTINIPYLERNKIFGKVILNRSKLSNLGTLDKGNIKITAVDSKGRKTSTLTNKNGEFVIYAPSVDKYDVYVNNIFQEHFDLRKNHYTVQLNGYKQFEVNFIFDEKRREINFTPSMTETDVEVKSVKRTNLTGTVKDENTLQPLRATIEVIDNKTGSTVETTRSDRETGRFSMSFMTGNNYSLIVSASGYWLHTETLDLDQMLTIQDVEKEILLKNIMIGSRLDLENLRFAPGSTEIPNDAYPELDRLIEQLKDNPNVRIQIAGHSDALEQLEDEDISEERAKAVAKYIMQNGFSNIEYVGYKDNKPVAPNDTPQNRAQNRRVEITVVDK